MNTIEQNTTDLNQILKRISELPNGEFYDGRYIVTPKSSKQTLDTTNKLFQGDLVVDKIPYAEVTNEKGGLTVTIG